MKIQVSQVETTKSVVEIKGENSIQPWFGVDNIEKKTIQWTTRTCMHNNIKEKKTTKNCENP